MLKNLLIGLDGSDDSRAALELGLRWARRLGARLTGLTIVDSPGILASGAALFGDGHYWRPPSLSLEVYRSSREARATLGQFARLCAEAGVDGTALEDLGTPFVQILLEAQCCDLVLLGRHTRFEYGCGEEPDETLARVVEDSPRPVVVVPEWPGRGESIVVAYDGSLQAARALHAFEATGLGEGPPVHVVSVAADVKDAARHAERAVRFLGAHGIAAATHPVEASGTVPEAVLSKVRSLEAGLVVMGAYGQPVLREFFLGSTTRTMIELCPVPLFLFH